jgi:O-antigen/teichoic acid export membrane protein
MLVLLMGDVLLVSLLLGNESVASYQVALQLGNMPFVLVTAFVNAWAPAVYARPAVSRWSWTRTTGTGLALVVAVGGGGVALLAPWLVAIAAPPTYDHQLIVTLVSLVVLVAPAYLIYNGSSLALIDAGETGRLAAAATAAAGVLIVVGFIAAVMGTGGVAAARVVGYLTLTVACAVLAGRHGLRWRGRTLAGIALLSLTASAAGALLPAAGPGAGARVAMALVLGTGLVAALWIWRGRLLGSDPRA